MLTKQEFVGKQFYSFCQQEFDNARKYLNTCGKPKTSFDKFLISEAKITVKIFKGFLK